MGVYRAVYGIKMFRTRIGGGENVFDADPEFEANSEQAAKASITRYANKDERIQDVSGTVKEQEQGELPDWWTPEPAKWESWKEIKREPYKKKKGFVYIECYRRSMDQFVSDGDPNKASISVFAYIRLAWLEPAQDGVITKPTLSK